ncbi:hypothetical protein TVAGG3_0898760, partial [Trichomonas vaginalis G3]|uniref:hypothetical protein n=2 Tax=Trichomonas vaginalis (strain ATCC PRA-98 / G3) TaxID=412133 RepID=UPI0021E5DDDF
MKNDTTVYRSVYEALESILNFNPSGFDTKTTPSTMPFIVNGEIVSKNNETVYKSVYEALNYMLHFNPSGFDPQITSCTMPFIVNGEIVMKNDTTVSKSVRDILDYLLHLGPTGFDPYTTQCQVPFINDSAEIKLKTSTVDEAIADSLTKLLDIIMRFNTFKTTYETFKKNYDDFFKITYIEPSAPQTPDYACLKIKAARTQVRTLTFDGDNIVRDVTPGDTLLTKEYLKSHISDFVKVEQSGAGKSWLGWLFTLFSSGVTTASLITMQSEIDALWAFLGGIDSMKFYVEFAKLHGNTGSFFDGLKNLWGKVTYNTKKLTNWALK